MKKRKVLLSLSDRDPFLLKVYEHKFKKIDGWDVILSYTAEELYKTVLREKPDLIVTDIILKQGHAYEALEKIKKHKSKAIKSIPIIILTDLAQDEDRSKAEELGASVYLVKSETSFDEVVEEVTSLQKNMKKSR